MHYMAVDEFWIPETLCGIQAVCKPTTSQPETTTGSYFNFLPEKKIINLHS